MFWGESCSCFTFTYRKSVNGTPHAFAFHFCAGRRVALHVHSRSLTMRWLLFHVTIRLLFVFWSLGLLLNHHFLTTNAQKPTSHDISFCSEFTRIALESSRVKFIVGLFVSIFVLGSPTSTGSVRMVRRPAWDALKPCRVTSRHQIRLQPHSAHQSLAGLQLVSQSVYYSSDAAEVGIGREIRCVGHRGSRRWEIMETNW